MNTYIKHYTPRILRAGSARAYTSFQPYVYVLHCQRPLHHSSHYTGFTTNIDVRMRLHRAGQGARLTRAYNEAGIEYELALLIPVKDCTEGHALERSLKAKHGARQYCPICKGLPVDDHVFMRQGHQRLEWRSEQARPRRPMGIARNRPFR